MLEEIGTPDKIPAALARAKDKGDAFRLMGFGHRVYKSYDPRAKIMRGVCHNVLDHLNSRWVCVVSVMQYWPNVRRQLGGEVERCPRTSPPAQQHGSKLSAHDPTCLQTCSMLCCRSNGS